MTSRSQITMDPGLQRRARQRASELGLSVAEYVRRAVLRDLGEKQSKPEVSILHLGVRLRRGLQHPQGYCVFDTELFVVHVLSTNSR